MYYKLDARDVVEPRTPMIGDGLVTSDHRSPMTGPETPALADSPTSPMVGGSTSASPRA